MTSRRTSRSRCASWERKEASGIATEVRWIPDSLAKRWDVRAATVAGSRPRPYCIAVPRSGSALVGLRFSLVGAGRVGRSLASWAASGGAQWVALAGRAGGDTSLAARFGARAVALDRL